MKKRYAHLALMITSMMSSQLLWGAQATAADVVDVRRDLWLRSDVDHATSAQRTVNDGLVQHTTKALKALDLFLLPDGYDRSSSDIIRPCQHESQSVKMFHQHLNAKVGEIVNVQSSKWYKGDDKTKIIASLDRISGLVDLSDLTDLSANSNHPIITEIVNIFVKNMQIAFRFMCSVDEEQKLKNRTRHKIAIRLIDRLCFDPQPPSTEDIFDIFERVDKIEDDKHDIYLRIISAILGSQPEFRLNKKLLRIIEDIDDVSDFLQDENNLDLCIYFIRLRSRVGIDIRRIVFYAIHNATRLPAGLVDTFKQFMNFETINYSNTLGIIPIVGYLDEIPQYIVNNPVFIKTCKDFVALADGAEMHPFDLLYIIQSVVTFSEKTLDDADFFDVCKRVIKKVTNDRNGFAIPCIIKMVAEMPEDRLNDQEFIKNEYKNLSETYPLEFCNYFY